MEKETGVVATEVLHLMKRSLKRIYGLLIIFIILFVVSITDSIYQRCRLIRVIKDYENMITGKICENNAEYSSDVELEKG